MQQEDNGLASSTTKLLQIILYICMLGEKKKKEPLFISVNLMSFSLFSDPIIDVCVQEDV